VYDHHFLPQSPCTHTHTLCITLLHIDTTTDMHLQLRLCSHQWWEPSCHSWSWVSDQTSTRTGYTYPKIDASWPQNWMPWDSRGRFPITFLKLSRTIQNLFLTSSYFPCQWTTIHWWRVWITGIGFQKQQQIFKQARAGHSRPSITALSLSLSQPSIFSTPTHTQT